MSPHIERLATIAVSFLALAISAAALYHQSAYERSSLSMQLMSFSMEPHQTYGLVCQMDVALFNSGNRDAALIGATLEQFKTVRTDSGSTSKFETASSSYFPDGGAPGYVTYVVKGGEVRLATIKFAGCNAETVRTNLIKNGLSDFALSTVALDHQGLRSNASVLFARANSPESGRVTVQMRLDGQFDLLVDKADYGGEAVRGSKEFWFKGDGKVWEQGYNYADQFKSKPPRQWR